MKLRNKNTTTGLVICVFGLCATIATAETVTVQNYLYKEGVAKYQRRNMFVIGNGHEPTRLAPPTLSLPTGLQLRSVEKTSRTTVLQKRLLVRGVKQKKPEISADKKQMDVEEGVTSPEKSMRHKVTLQKERVSDLPTARVVASTKDPLVGTDARYVRAEPQIETKKPVSKPETKTKSSIKTKRQKVSLEKTPVSVKVIQSPKSPERSTTKNKQTTSPNLKGQCDAPTIQFKLASTWVHPKVAKGLVKTLMDCGVKKVRVVGFTCDLGNKQVNDRMALGRAKVVAKLLRKKGFEVVEVNGKGKSGYLTRDPKNRKMNRRVEVQIAG